MNKNLSLLILIAGGVSSLAYSPFNYIAFLYIGYIFLYYAFYKALNIKEYFIYGFTFGLAHFSVGNYWLFSIIDSSSNENNIVLFLIIIGIILLLSLYFAFLGLFIGLLRPLTSNIGIWILLVFPTLSTLIEWVRSWFLTGFTWLSPADTLVNFGFAPFLPLTGTLGLSFSFYLLISFFIYLIIKPSIKSLLSFVFLLISLFFLKTQNYTKPLKPNVYVQIIQSHFTKDDKSKRYKVIKRLKRFQALANQEPRVNLSVWAESSMSIEYENLKNYLGDGFETLRENEVEVFYGAYKKSQNVLMQNSNEQAVYVKQHLMPFGEYTPRWLMRLKQLLPNFQNADLTSDFKVSPIVLNDVRYAPSICYELLFPEELRSLAEKSNVLLHVSDLGWFNHSWAQSYLLNLAKMRSMEHQKPMIYVVNAGNSAFILPTGEVKEFSSSTTGIQALYAHVLPYEGKTPYAKYGEKPLLYFLAFLLALYLLWGRRKMS